jgi:hypothetical protein
LKEITVKFINQNNEYYNLIEGIFQEESINMDFAFMGTLDVFSYCLSEDEARELIIPYNYHLEHESKFIDFFRSMFESNIDHNCTIYLREPLQKLRKHDKNRLNENEIEIFNFVRRQNVKIVIAENATELDFFVRLSTQEIHFCDYILDNEKVIIRGNYDLSFPIYYQEQKYRDLVENNNLHVRL